MIAGAASDAFLGVTKSATTRVWRARLPEDRLREARTISELTGVPEIVARVLAGRDVAAEDAAAFLDPRLRDLMPDPRTLTDMEKASSRIADAVTRGERVAIFGDYDVDGATSSALMKRFFDHLGLDASIHIPDRIFEGYGPNDAAFDAFAADKRALVITVDCGTASHETIAHANDLGLEVVVIDHHQTGETLPPALALVNPNRQDDLSGQGHLCAAGVVFLVLVDVARRLREAGRGDLPNLLDWLDLVALGTVADIVPLKGLNRGYVRQGLRVMHARQNIGLRALCDVARLRDPPTPYHLGFLLGPRINAGGRIGDAALGARLLTTDDSAEAGAIAAKLDELNRERQEMERAALEDALAAAEGDDRAALVLANDDWHPGIVGLIAARVKERFGKPAIAITFAAGDEGSGSARSVSGVDIGALIRDAVEDGVLIKGGGHAMAAGLTIARDKVDGFRQQVSQGVSDLRDGMPAEDTLKIDGALTAGAATRGLIDALDQAGPYGQGHPEPVVALPAHRLTFCEATQQGHVRFALAGPGEAKLQGIAFRAAGQPLGEFLERSRGKPIHTAGALRLNRWGNNETVQLQLRDAAATGAE